VTTAEGLLDDLEARGLVHDTTDRQALADRMSAGPLTLYYGCDPSADSLHIGNLIGLLVLRRFQDAGHRPVALAGGATGMVGDPSGRSDERNLLDEAALSANVAAIKAQMARILDFDDGRAVLVDNRDWTAGVTLLDFLRDVGKHVTVNQMLARESVKARLASEHGISYTEFSYMLLQAHDYLRLHRDLGVELQIGGSDQWGNILSGIDLIRRVDGAAVHGLSWPLLTAPDGSKLGKTTGARIWLDPARTSPYQFFQHWMQTDDRQVGEFLAKFTLLQWAEVEAVTAAHLEHPERREGQRRLADEVAARRPRRGAGGGGGRGADRPAPARRRARRRRRPGRPPGRVGPGVVEGGRQALDRAGRGQRERSESRPRRGGAGGGAAARPIRAAAQGQAPLRAAGARRTVIGRRRISR
jgi:tyrosyl-tRNA synthetase